MIEVGVTVEVDNASPALARVQSWLNSDGPQKIAGYEGQRLVREHLGNLDYERANRLGGPRTHYYGSARKATTFYQEADYVVVNIAQVGMALHYYGGIVQAGANVSFATGMATKYLTIPVDPEAHGHTASDFDLVLLWGRNGPYGLALAERTEKMTLHGGLRVTTRPGKMMFSLRKEVDIQPDKSVLPEPSMMAQSIGDKISAVISRRWGSGASIEVEPTE